MLYNNIIVIILLIKSIFIYLFYINQFNLIQFNLITFSFERKRNRNKKRLMKKHFDQKNGSTIFISFIKNLRKSIRSDYFSRTMTK